MAALAVPVGRQPEASPATGVDASGADSVITQPLPCTMIVSNDPRPWMASPHIEVSAMTRQVKARRVTTRKSFQPRDFWLAGLGAASLARKQVLSSYSLLVARAQTLRAQSSKAVVDTLGNADATLSNVRETVLDRTTAAQARAGEVIGQVRSAAESALAPVLARFGIKAKAKRARKPARKPAARRATSTPPKARRKAA